MEEKTFSPEQPEDVIELFDIVEPVASDDSPVQAEQGEIPSESAEACLNASSGEETADGVHDSRLPEDPDESYGEDGIPPQPSEQTQKGSPPFRRRNGRRMVRKRFRPARRSSGIFPLKMILLSCVIWKQDLPRLKGQTEN